jgi:hypothetical protein
MNQFVCDQCGERFDEKGLRDQHMACPHPAPELTAADLEKTMCAVDFPKSKADLVAFATRQAPAEMAIVKAIEALPDRVYRSAAEVVGAFKGATAPVRTQQPAQHAR